MFRFSCIGDINIITHVFHFYENQNSVYAARMVIGCPY